MSYSFDITNPNLSLSIYYWTDHENGQTWRCVKFNYPDYKRPVKYRGLINKLLNRICVTNEYRNYELE
jgi:hypothetical protein